MSRVTPIWLFAFAALLPPAFLAMGLVFGGVMAWAGFAAITVFAALMDRFGGLFMGNAPEGAEFPAADSLLVALATLHIVLLPWLVAHLAGAAPLSDKIGLFLGASLWLGQISNPASHELIHRAPRALFALGTVMFGMVLFGHQVEI